MGRRRSSGGRRMTAPPVSIRSLVAVADQAACIGMPLDLFFPTGDEGCSSGEKAVTVCRSCPIQQPCLDAALANRESVGVWGATLPHQRAEIIRQRARRG